LEAETLNLAIVILRLLAVVFFMGAVTMDIFFMFNFSSPEKNLALPALRCIRERGFTLLIVALTLMTTLMFSVPTLFSDPRPATTPSGMLLGSLIYLATAALIVFFAVKHTHKSVARLFSNPESTLKIALSRGVVYGIAAIPPVIAISLVMSTVIKNMGYLGESQPVVGLLTNSDTTAMTRIVIIFCAVVVAPIVEEVIFRGILFATVLKNNSFIFSALLVGCLFSLIHFHAPSFLSILALNMFFCAGYSSTGSLVTPIVMHMIFNGAAVFSALVLL